MRHRRCACCPFAGAQRALLNQPTGAASNGTFSISFTSPQSKNWDSCCFDATRPDPLLEVCGAWGGAGCLQLTRPSPHTTQPCTSVPCLPSQVTIGGTLWLKTSPVDDVAGDRSWGTLTLRTRTISGTVRWQGSGSPPAAGTVVKAYDNDSVGGRSASWQPFQPTGRQLITIHLAGWQGKAAVDLRPLPRTPRAAAPATGPRPAACPPAGREFMGEATTNTAGEFSIRTPMVKVGTSGGGRPATRRAGWCALPALLTAAAAHLPRRINSNGTRAAAPRPTQTSCLR